MAYRAIATANLDGVPVELGADKSPNTGGRVTRLGLYLRRLDEADATPRFIGRDGFKTPREILLYLQYGPSLGLTQVKAIDRTSA